MTSVCVAQHLADSKCVFILRKYDTASVTNMAPRTSFEVSTVRKQWEEMAPLSQKEA